MDIISDDKKNKIEKPETVIAKNLDEDRERRDFTINTIVQDVKGDYLDYIYTYRNKKISAINDIKNKVIRAVGNPKQRFEEDPTCK
jgi:tRNA nucleotidyltransferase (CCA-adding enzyme)